MGGAGVVGCHPPTREWRTPFSTEHGSGLNLNAGAHLSFDIF
jgi:hypothetical protein